MLRHGATVGLGLATRLLSLWLMLSLWLALGDWAVAAEVPVALTFDDLPAAHARQMDDAAIAAQLTALIEQLRTRQLPAVGFVNENKLRVGGELRPARVQLLRQWHEAGLELGNHTHDHASFDRTPLAAFQQQVLRGETVTLTVQPPGEQPRWFRYPYHHLGPDRATRERFETFLAEHGYRVAPVTANPNDWLFDLAYRRADDAATRARVVAAYVDYSRAILDHARQLSRDLFGRDIPQVLGLHANALNADHLDALLAALAPDYDFVDLATVVADPAYASPDRHRAPSGSDWLVRWSLSLGLNPQPVPVVPAWVRDLAGPEGRAY